MCYIDIYPKEIKRYLYTKAYTQMFVAAMIITVKKKKQCNYSLADGVVINTGKYYAAI
jgi:hypothetical protein